jgi:hypothetical protein
MVVEAERRARGLLGAVPRSLALFRAHIVAGLVARLFGPTVRTRRFLLLHGLGFGLNSGQIVERLRVCA